MHKEYRFNGMEPLNKEEQMANEKFIEFREATLKKDIPEDFYTKCWKYFDKFEDMEMFQLIK